MSVQILFESQTLVGFTPTCMVKMEEVFEWGEYLGQMFPNQVGDVLINEAGIFRYFGTINQDGWTSIAHVGDDVDDGAKSLPGV